MVRRTMTSLAILILLISCGLPQSRPEINQNNLIKDLNLMYQHHQYFELRDKLVQQEHLLPEKEVMLLSAQLHSVFNRRKASDSLISEIFRRFGNELSENQEIELLETKISNNLFLFNYKEAYEITERLLKMDSLSAEKRETHENQLIIFRELHEVPSQISKIIDSELPIEKDIAGLSRIPVKINKTAQEVVFDTGANFSVITDSLALRTGITIKEKTFKVTAITGEKVDSKIGVADSLRIGNSLLHNVVFLVFPEASLTFKEANYTIDAILGFPVINALEKIDLIKGKKFIISQEASHSLKENLALDFLTPIVEVHQNEKSLAFTFDTGASTTALYEDYFKLNESSIMEEGLRDSINLGGAGGAVRIPVYKAPFSGRIGDSEFHLKSANIYVQNRHDNPGIFGNLGQDVLQQFDTLSLNFKNMRIKLK